MTITQQHNIKTLQDINSTTKVSLRAKIAALKSQRTHREQRQSSIIETYDPDTGRLLRKESFVNKTKSEVEDKEEQSMKIHAKQSATLKVQQSFELIHKETLEVSKQLNDFSRNKAQMISRCYNFLLFNRKIFNRYPEAKQLLSLTCDEWNNMANSAGIVWRASRVKSCDDEDMELGDFMDLSTLVMYRLLTTGDQLDEKTGQLPALLYINCIDRPKQLGQKYKLRESDKQSIMVEGCFMFNQGRNRILIMHELVMRMYPPYADVIQAERIRHLQLGQNDVLKEVNAYNCEE